FIKQYSGLREHLLSSCDVRGLGDFDRGAFEDVPDEVVSVVVSVIHRAPHVGTSVASSPTPRDDHSRDSDRTRRKRAATLCHVGRHEFDPAALQVVPEWPLVYWWDEELLADYRNRPLLADASPSRAAQSTGDNARFVRQRWEVSI